MLTLTNALTIAGETVYQDDANQLAAFEQQIATRPTWQINDDGTVSEVKSNTPTQTETTPKTKYYLLPEMPVISKGPDGNPLFSLIIYRRDEARVTDPTQDVGGGILTFTTELISTKFDQVKSALNKQAGGSDGSDDVELDYVQFISGDIEVSVAGETGTSGDGTAEFVKTVIGNGKLGGVGSNRRAVMVKLTQDGANLFDQLDKLKTLPINILYNLTFEHRLLGVKMIAYCDVESSYLLIQQLSQQDTSYSSGYGGLSTDHQDPSYVSQVTEALVRSKTMYVTVIPESSQVDQDTITALEKEGTDILNKEVAGVLEAGPIPDTLDRNEISKFAQTYNSALNYTIDREMVLTQTFTPSANLQNLLVGANLADLVAYVDLRTAFFTFLQVPIRVNADFESNSLDSVTVTVTYNRTAMDGSGAQQVRDSFNFTDGATINKFLAYANSLADVAYDWSAEVHYKGSDQTFTLSQSGVHDNFLVVDVGQLGLLNVTFSLGLHDDELYPMAVVTARYQSHVLGREVSTELRLDKNAQSQLWSAVILEEPKNGFEYKVDWLRVDPDGKTAPEVLEGAWVSSTASSVEVDSPVKEQMHIAVSCSGNFTSEPNQLSQVVVALHYADETNNHVVDESLTFTADHQTQTFDVDLIDPTKRDYTYQYANIYQGGVIEHFPADGSWAAGDPGFIVVGEKFSMTLPVLPLLLHFGDTLTAAEVDLDYDDGSGTPLTETFVFSATAQDVQTWYVKGQQGASKTFGYVVKYFWADGTQTQAQRQTSDQDKLLIPPPAPAPVPVSAPQPPAPPAPAAPVGAPAG
ncbi:MAG TPA: hypothetical protein VGH30_06170 [Jatrophihabitantaceae bacterium]